MSTDAQAEAPVLDERLVKAGFVESLLRRPELGAASGFLVVLIIFGLMVWQGYANQAMFQPLGIINWASVSAYLGVIAIGACLLMIAGEFDLSVGSMIAFSGMCMVLLIRFGGFPAWAAILIGFAVALSIGALIGMLVVRTGLPSFIVSLAFLFILRGATLVIARVFNGSTQVGGVGDYKDTDWLAWLFGGDAFTGLFIWMAEVGIIDKLRNGKPAIQGIPMIVVWCVLLGIACAFILTKTRFGNWIFATGGDANAAKSAGIPVNRVRVQLFMFTAFCAAVFAAAQVFEFGSADGNRGLLKEFEAIIAAVVGGALLTGGYGSVIGAIVGAMVYGAVSQGFFYTNFLDGDSFRIFVGAVLLGAVMFNNFVRKRMTGGL